MFGFTLQRPMNIQPFLKNTSLTPLLKNVLVFGYVLFLGACSGDYFEDNKLINLLDYQDQRDSVEVLSKIENSKTPKEHRKIAIEALGSMQPITGKRVLMDIISNEKENESIKQAAVFSLGQYHDSAYTTQLIALFEQESNSIQHEIIKALGKMGGQAMAGFYSGFNKDKTNKYSESLALSLAYFSKRNPVFPKGIDQTISILKEGEYPASSFAANTLNNWNKSLSQTQAKEIVAIIPKLKPTAQFHALKALTNWAKNESMNAQFIELKKSVGFENEHALISLINFKGKESLAFEWVKKGIKPAAEIALANNCTDWEIKNQDHLFELLKSNRAKSVILRNQLLSNIESKTGIDTLISKKIILLYQQTQLVYDRGFILLALSESWKNLPFLENEMNATSDLIVRQKAFEAILLVRQSKYFALFEQEWKKEFPKLTSFDDYFSNIINQAIGSRDVGLLAQSCELLLQNELSNSTQLLSSIDTSALSYRLRNLQLPRDIEIYNLTSKLISKLKGKVNVSQSVAYNNAMDWPYIKRLPKMVNVIFTTNKGDFEIACTTQLTPGTVAQFCRLVGNGFYDGKVFHRIVPNFVVQGGCPRGDGYGSTNETIRSEFTNQSFSYGSVGMASAGKDTESCQFFVMTGDHPHLDGRYTQFGNVTSGMDVILKLEEGDYIIQADFKP